MHLIQTILVVFVQLVGELVIIVELYVPFVFQYLIHK